MSRAARTPMIGTIERGLPPPEKDRRRALRNPVSLALEALQPGESRVFQCGEALPSVVLSKLCYRALGKGMFRTAPAEQPGTVRVWRLG